MYKRYKAFTLVELLIVMGILIILMTLGILVGRYGVQRANDVAHRDAAEKLYKIMLEYKNDNGEYPRIDGYQEGDDYFAEALGYYGDDNRLEKYLDQGGFDGGTDATYYVSIDPVDAQFVVVCVSLGGEDDERERGFYCVGDGLGFLPAGVTPVSSSEVGVDDPARGSILGMNGSDWVLNEGFAR